MWKLAPSSIHGQGVHATVNIKKDTLIGLGIYFTLIFIPVVTEDFGSYINHSYEPNASLVFDGEESWKWNVVANKDINSNEEITLDYRDPPWYIKGPEDEWKLKQRTESIT